MGARCAGAPALGTATLAGWRFTINPDGFGSIAPRPGGCVHGVLWRLSARDLAAINAYESVDSGLYLRRRLTVRHGSRHVAGAGLHRAPARGGNAAAGIHPSGGGSGARLGFARALHSVASALVAVGMARRAGEGHRRGRMSAQTIRHVVIRGRVQGVGYRAFTEYTASIMALKAGCATGATARSKRYSRVRPRRSRR